MATQYIKFTGPCEWAKVWPNQIDRKYEEEGDKKGGKWDIVVELNDEDLKTYNALGLKISHEVRQKQPKVSFHRYERHPVLGELGAPTVTGVPEGQLIGNGSIVTVDVEVYDYTYKNKPGRSARLAGVAVEKLVEYKKPDATGPKPVPVPVD